MAVKIFYLKIEVKTLKIVRANVILVNMSKKCLIEHFMVRPCRTVETGITVYVVLLGWLPALGVLRYLIRL
jgi:hypothetical protein